MPTRVEALSEEDRESIGIMEESFVSDLLVRINLRTDRVLIQHWS